LKVADRFDDLLIKARAEMLGKHTLRAEPQTDVVFEYVWDQMQKGFKDGLKQGYADNRNKKESGSSQPKSLQDAGNRAAERREQRNKKAKERRERKKTEAMANARMDSERRASEPDLTQEMAEANPPKPKGPTGPPPSKRPSATDMDDIRARVDALRNPTPTETPSAADAGFAAMGQSGDAGVQAPPSQPPAPQTGPNPPPLPEGVAPGYTPPAPAQPPADPFAALGVGAHNPVSRNQNVSNPNTDPWAGVRGGRLADLQPLSKPTPTQTALQNNPVAPSQMDVGDAMNVLDNSGAQAPPTMSQPRGKPAESKQTDDGSLSDANAVLDGKVNYSDPRSVRGGERVPVDNQTGKTPPTGQGYGTTANRSKGGSVGQFREQPSPFAGRTDGVPMRTQPQGLPYKPMKPQAPPSGLEMAMTQNPQQNPDATVAAANKRQMERNERRGQPQTNLFDFQRSVVKNPFANPFHNPHAFDVHDNFGMEKMNPRLPKDGALDGVLSRNPDPPAMNAGMPRDPDLLERLKRMYGDKMKEKPPWPPEDEPPSADTFARQKSFDNANLSLLPAGLIKEMKGQQKADADYSLLPSGWREEVV